MKRYVSFVLLFFFISSALSFAEEVKISAIVPKPPSVGLPKTGQITSHRSYDDGYYKKIGLPPTGPKYTDNGNNTITDNATGLMWIQDPSILGGTNWSSNPGHPNNPKLVTWDNAFIYITALNADPSHNAGHSDWRMPNIKELQSIVNYGYDDTLIGSHAWIGEQGTSPVPFSCTAGYYWSSTSLLGINPFRVDFSSGNVVTSGSTVYVRPVRGPD